MDGYALESDCRTSFRLFCRTRYEISSKSNVRLGSDWRGFHERSVTANNQDKTYAREMSA